MISLSDLRIKRDGKLVRLTVTEVNDLCDSDLEKVVLTTKEGRFFRFKELHPTKYK